MFLLQEAIHAAYQDFGVYADRAAKYPTFQDVYRWLKDHPVKGRKALWMDSAMRAVQSICFGHMGRVVNTAVQANLGELLERNVILELDGLTNADKTLITEALLLWTHHYRLAQPHRETFKHAIIIEEAHHILRKQTGGHGGETITETILREIRELGEAIVLVDQHPSMISIPALGNTYTTITMNLKHRSDVTAVGAAMLMEDEDRDILGILPIGTAVVKLQGRWPRPFQVRIPHWEIPKGAITDLELMQRMTTLTGIVPNSRGEEDHDETERDPSESELRLLKDIADHPLSGVVERYKRLGVSRRKGNKWKEACMAKGWIEPVTIPTGSGRVVLLELSQGARQCLAKGGVQAPDASRWGSLEHEYWKERIAKHLQDLGLEVYVEKPVNGYTDIIAKSGGIEVAVEVETGKSDWQANLRKNRRRGFHRIVVAATNEEAQRTIEKALEGQSDGVTVLPAWEVAETLNAAALVR